MNSIVLLFWVFALVWFWPPLSFFLLLGKLIIAFPTPLLSTFHFRNTVSLVFETDGGDGCSLFSHEFFFLG